MFSMSTASPSARTARFAATYRQVGVQTNVSGANAHQLVGLLFEGCMDALAQASSAIQSGCTEAKCRAIGRALGIVNEGLKAGLNLQAGGPLAADLDSLYAYICVRLSQANLRNDEAALAECRRLLKPLQEAWAAIGQKPEALRVN